MDTNTFIQPSWRQRYTLALTGLALLFTLALGLTGYRVSEQADNANGMSVAVAQVVLLQRIALYGRQLPEHASDRPHNYRQLQQALASLQANHRLLTGGAPDAGTATPVAVQAKRLMDRGSPSLHTRMSEYIAATSKLLGTGGAAAIDLAVVSNDALVSEHQQLITVLQQQTQQSAERLQWAIVGIWILLLGALAGHIKIVVKPVLRAFNDYREVLDSERERLVALQEQAQQAERVKTHFLTNMGHELRTPLNGIFGMIELATGEQNEQQRQGFLRQAANSGRHLLRMINDVLDISTIDSKELHVKLRDFELMVVLDSCLAPFAILCQQRGLKFRFVAETDLPMWVKTDPERLSQILNHLLSNAEKYTERGEIVVRAGVKVRQGLVLEMSVSDTGVGIDPADRERIFEKFTQIDDSKTRRYPGSGLGLFMCRQLTELLGGQLRLDSVVDQGSAFYLQLPLGRPVNKADMPHSDPNLSDVKVAIVDDLDTSRQYLQLVIRRLGIEPDVYQSGDDLLRSIATAGDYFCIFIDLHMPGADGVQVAQRLVAQFGDSCPSLLLVSAAVEDIAKYGDAGQLFAEIYPKPLDEYAITRDLRFALGRDVSAMSPQQSLTILVVEDNEINAQILAHMLDTNGHRVEHALNGEEAVGKVQQMDFDLVFMDVDMPVMDGLTATRIIKQELGLKLPIVAVTSNGYARDKQASLEAGMAFHICKPIDRNTVMNIPKLPQDAYFRAITALAEQGTLAKECHYLSNKCNAGSSYRRLHGCRR